MGDRRPHFCEGGRLALKTVLHLWATHFDEANRPQSMYTPTSFPCVAWRISPRTFSPIPVIVEGPYLGLYHTDHGSTNYDALFICDSFSEAVGGCMWLLHCSELFSTHGHALQHCRTEIDLRIRRYLASVADREDQRFKHVECRVPMGDEQGAAA